MAAHPPTAQGEAGPCHKDPQHEAPQARAWADPGAQHEGQGQQGNGGQIVEHRHPHKQPPRGRVESAPLGQHPQGDTGAGGTQGCDEQQGRSGLQAKGLLQGPPGQQGRQGREQHRAQHRRGPGSQQPAANLQAHLEEQGEHPQLHQPREGTNLGEGQHRVAQHKTNRQLQHDRGHGPAGKAGRGEPRKPNPHQQQQQGGEQGITH